MVLEDEARPAQLRSCNPWGECKFSLQMRKGGLVRVYDSVLVRVLCTVLECVTMWFIEDGNGICNVVKLRQGSGKDRQGMALKAKGLKA